jgi:hypothetical protein
MPEVKRVKKPPPPSRSSVHPGVLATKIYCSWENKLERFFFVSFYNLILYLIKYREFLLKGKAQIQNREVLLKERLSTADLLARTSLD